MLIFTTECTAYARARIQNDNAHGSCMDDKNDCVLNKKKKRKKITLEANDVFFFHVLLFILVIQK